MHWFNTQLERKVNELEQSYVYKDYDYPEQIFELPNITLIKNNSHLYWRLLPYYQSLKDLGGCRLDNIIEARLDVCMGGADHIFMFYDLVIISEKPVKVHTELVKDEAYPDLVRLHSIQEAAMKWEDGYELHVVHGYKVTSVNNFDMSEFMEYPDSIRSEFIQKFGVNKILNRFYSRIIDNCNDFVLFEILTKESNPMKFIKKGHIYNENTKPYPVPANITSCEEAIKFGGIFI